jgi:tetratricopeptide (TPR) repeat protein
MEDGSAMSKKPGDGGRFEHLEFDELGSQSEQERQMQQRPSGVLSAPEMERHAYHERAVQAFQRGEFEQALRYFTRALELDRTLVPAWVGQVQMLIELDELRETELWVDKALELFRDQGELLSAKGVVKARRGDRRAGMACSDSALAARGSSAYRWLARGEILLVRGETQVSATFDRAMQEEGANWFTRIWAARIYRRYGRHTPAALLARQATETGAQHPYAWYIRGLCERDLGLGAYRLSLQRALQLDGTFIAAREAMREQTSGGWLRGLYRRLRGG